MKIKTATPTNKPRGQRLPGYVAAYPFAIEVVYAKRLGDFTRRYGKWVRAASLKTYRAIAKSGAVMNTDADGDDFIDANHEILVALTAKKVADYLRQTTGTAFSKLPEAEREQLIAAIVAQLTPETLPLLRQMGDLLNDGLFGAVPAHMASEVSRQSALDIAKDVERVTGASMEQNVKAINRVADTVQKEIERGKFGLTDEYYDNYYRRFIQAKPKLIDMRTGLPATAEKGGAVSPRIMQITKPLRQSGAVKTIKATDTASTELLNHGAEDFKLIVRAAAGQELAPGIHLPDVSIVDDIAIDIYDGDKQLLRDTERWLTDTMGKMQNVTEDALGRGIKVMQNGLREGRGVDYIAAQLEKEMEIPWRRARNVARNEIGNQAWNISYGNARIGGMEYYDWHGMLDEVERHQHVIREGKSYSPKKPPPDGNPGEPHGCRCFPRWLFTKRDVARAEAEIAARITH
ncbi:phage minor head protein [Kosakonia sacchari]|uniref:phage minor head protein n=1 Tax=Kosakonia sacchari TaxID=1158459 RepID=UPI001585A3A3|nr:phage minor head protein [Kosakonia sacchari]NUL35054.1 phage head morphogenesis protein [Kosakonia sacchari]